MRLTDLAGLAFTYPDVGATAGELPSDYHHVRASAQMGPAERDSTQPPTRCCAGACSGVSG